MRVLFVLGWALLATTAISCSDPNDFWDEGAFADPLARRALRADVAGCYVLLGESAKPAPDVFFAAPEFVELMADSSMDSLGQLRPVRRVLAGGRKSARLQDSFATTRWKADSLTDSIRIQLGDGFSGTDFILAAPGETPNRLVGRARAWMDLGPTGEEAGPAEARRVPCPIPGPDSASSASAT